MNSRAFCFIAVSLYALQVSPAGAAEPQLPFPQHVQYSGDGLRPSHRTQAQQDADVVAAYGSWKSRYLEQVGTEPDGHPRYRVKTSTDATAHTVSEGQGYGMLIAVHLAGSEPDAQQIFDGIWEFCLDHPSTIDSRLSDWYVNWDESPDGNGDNSAFDGDADIAYALLLAERQWGNNDRFAYRAEALRVIAGMLASTIGPQSRLPMLGDWVDPNGSPYSQWTTRSSDFMTGHFRAFAAVTGDGAWDEVVDAVQNATEHLQTAFSPTAGLLPDFAVPMSSVDHTLQPAAAGFLEGDHDGHYFYNAGRDPWRLTTDALVNDDAVSRAQALRMAEWVRTSTGADPQQIDAGFELDGTGIGQYFTSFFVAPFGVASMVDPAGQAFLNDTYDSVRSQVENYYEDSVTLLSLLVMTGNFLDPVHLFVDGFESGDTSRWSGSSGPSPRPDLER